jgi:D-alanyl-D-alanine carboxypeptidase/D-alanyl-D-alanine-endopeptidase (penicillin-binding protein 4)
LQARVEAELARAATGTRFGLVVADDQGHEIVAINPDQRFIPASVTKVVTTAAAWATLTDLTLPDRSGGAAVRIVGRDVILTGHGDARLSSAPDCVANCLAQLADAIAARTRRVDRVIGDATRFPDERWSAGMSWNNIPTRSGTAIAALSLDDNELVLRVTPGAVGAAPAIDHPGYLAIDNRAATVAAGETALLVHRLPFDRTIRIAGTIAADAGPRIVRMGIDDPAHYAAWRLAALLRERKVKVRGDIVSRYGAAVAATAPDLAKLVPPPLADDIRDINKLSQNLHAELLLRRLSRHDGDGSVADGQRRVDAMFAAVGVPRTAWDLADGSGMSSYNRIAPRGMVMLLRWIAAQPWGAAWRATLPVGGVDGTLARRFRGTALEGRIFAKTGSLNGTATLAGYLLGKRGRVLSFALFANDVPSGASALPAMDAALIAIADDY